MADDHSDRGALTSALPLVAADSDVLLGPYSTGLLRAAGPLAAEHGWLLWNHGGAGDVTTGPPGHIASILSPARRYAEPFVEHLAGRPDRVPLWIAHGPGRFGRQVAAGAEAAARAHGLQTARLDHATSGPPGAGRWDLFCAGSFEEDVDLIGRAQAAASPPRLIGAVAAGVREFGTSGVDPAGVYGVGQWFPGQPGARDPRIGPAEDDFLAAYAAAHGPVPDYPAIQAVAAAALAAHCHRQAAPGDHSDPGDLWQAALDLDTSTLFGRFRIRPGDGQQEAHRTVLVRWDRQQPALVLRPR